jgi:hypothetical protein
MIAFPMKKLRLAKRPRQSTPEIRARGGARD